MTELLSTLLCGVRDSDPDTRILFCTCLGEVGAIDAGLLDSVISTEISKHKVLFYGTNNCIFVKLDTKVECVLFSYIIYENLSFSYIIYATSHLNRYASIMSQVKDLL